MVSTFIQFSDLYNSKIDSIDAEINTLLAQLNREEILHYLFQLLNIISKPNASIKEQKQILAEISPVEKKDKIIKLIVKRKNAIFFFRGQICELINKALSFGDEKYDLKKALENAENREKLFKLLLLSSEIWSNKTYEIFRKEEVEYYHYAIAFRKGIEYANPSTEYYIYLAKTIELYNEIFPVVEKDFQKIFKDSIGLSVNEYIICYAYILTFINHNSECARGLFSDKSILDLTKDKELIIKFFENNSVELDQLYKIKNISEMLLNYPIIKINNDFLIGDYINLLNVMIDGPIFKLKGDRATWLSKYGSVIESYIIKILERIYPHSDIIQNRLHKKVIYNCEKRKYEIDSAILNPESIIFIEMKQSFLNKEANDVEDPVKYLNQLNEKYGISKNGENDKIKGIGQIKRHIDKYIEGFITELPVMKKIYPVLIVNDSLITSSLTNKYISKEFNDLFQDKILLKDNSIKLNDYRIYPLVIMSVKELEMMEISINKYGLEVILNGYYEFNKSGNESLYNFFAQSNFVMFQNPYLAEKGLEYLEKMGDTFFPEIMEQIKKNKENKT